jgi:hypothetical protein
MTTSIWLDALCRLVAGQALVFWLVNKVPPGAPITFSPSLWREFSLLVCGIGCAALPCHRAARAGTGGEDRFVYHPLAASGLTLFGGQAFIQHLVNLQLFRARA